MPEPNNSFFYIDGKLDYIKDRNYLFEFEKEEIVQDIISCSVSNNVSNIVSNNVSNIVSNNVSNIMSNVSNIMSNVSNIISDNVPDKQNSKCDQHFNDNFKLFFDNNQEDTPMIISDDNIDSLQSIPITNIDSVPPTYVPLTPLYINNSCIKVNEKDHKNIIVKLCLFLNKYKDITYEFSTFNCTWYITYVQSCDITHLFEIYLYKGRTEDYHIMDIKYFEGHWILFGDFYCKLRSEFI